MNDKKYNTGIYKIEHIASGKIYIGSAVDCARRWIEHRARLKAKTHPNKKLENAWHKYGAEAFTFTVLLYCEVKDLMDYEQRALDSYEAMTDKGYNLCPVAGSVLGIKRSDETRKKMSEAQKGKPRWSDEDKKRIAEQMTGTKRNPHSDETKEKMRVAKIGLKLGPQSDETIAKRSAALKGRPRTEETKRKISETKRNKKAQ